MSYLSVNVFYIAGIKFCLKLAENTTAFQSVGAKFLDVQLPGCEGHVYRSDAYFECYLRHFAMHVWHPVGTCKMGRGRSDRTAVVDSKLRFGPYSFLKNQRADIYLFSCFHMIMSYCTLEMSRVKVF